ncbi:hypothetical protein [Roseibium sp. RKSG952]|uniref:hypothetical protein n=1 Tax=Roseibium sp. RKSG952 TaxID=2529384 RepID=UPI0012BC6764|nr:hypothetical protein [Roseibium sp. RKSG952]MTH94994.1 hypothetical protein [Roseibium sp. RKSG952]
MVKTKPISGPFPAPRSFRAYRLCSIGGRKTGSGPRSPGSGGAEIKTEHRANSRVPNETIEFRPSAGNLEIGVLSIMSIIPFLALNGDQVRQWMNQMKAAGKVRTSRECNEALGITPDGFSRLKRNGCDLRTALAMQAILYGLKPYGQEAKDVRQWVEDMKDEGLAKTSKECHQRIGLSMNGIAVMKRRGCNKRTALAMQAALYGLMPYGKDTGQETEQYGGEKDEEHRKTAVY